MEKKNNISKRFSIYIYIELASAILFSLFSLSFHADISLVAFPVSLIYTAITVYFCFFKVDHKKDATHIPVILRLTQYLPFVLLFCFIIRRAGEYGTAYWYDVVTVLIWCVVFIFSLILSHCMNEKRIKAVTEGWNVPYTKKKKRHGIAWVLFEILDWIDAIVQAVCMVLLIQIFILQLYVIPSESMVPTFLVKDRVVVTKLNCGPKFPLTEIGFTDFKPYKRGQIVVVRNPHYKMDRKSEIRTVTSQLVHMLTFTAVNINTDENGNPKYDPLVKRICGVPGEQLVMQDGTLYHRTKDSDDFTPVTEDEKFACWDLSSVNKNLLSKIQTFPLASTYNGNLNTVVSSASQNYQKMLDFEEKRRDYDLDSASSCDVKKDADDDDYADDDVSEGNRDIGHGKAVLEDRPYGRACDHAYEVTAAAQSGDTADNRRSNTVHLIGHTGLHGAHSGCSHRDEAGCEGAECGNQASRRAARPPSSRTSDPKGSSPSFSWRRGQLPPTASGSGRPTPARRAPVPAG